MGGLARGLVWRWLAAVACVVATVWLAVWYFIPAPPHEITIAAGIKNGAFERIANSYRERLARHHVTLNVRITTGAQQGLALVQDPNSGVDAAFLFAGLSNSTESPRLLSLGRINYAPLWIFYKGETLDRLTQIKGKRINVGPALRITQTKILAAHGVNESNTAFLPLVGPAAAEALKAGKIDVAFLPPQELSSPLVQSMLRDPTIRMMSLTQADALTRLFPELHRLVLPQGVVDLEKNIPSADVNLLASTNVVLVRKELHPELIYLLAQTLQEEHGGDGIFQHAGEFPTQTDPEFPVAEEARDFYKNGPSFLQRYLPFWMISYAKRVAAIMVAAVAIIIPLFTYAPKFYDWLLQSHLNKLYRRLRVVEDGMQGDLTSAQVMALQGDLESINRAARILPRRHSDLFFSLIMHIDLVRTRLASRLAELQPARRMA